MDAGGAGGRRNRLPAASPGSRSLEIFALALHGLRVRAPHPVLGLSQSAPPLWHLLARGLDGPAA